MSNNSYNGSINLQKCKGARRIIANGVKGIFIPTDGNPTIYVSEKGAYMSIRVRESEREFDGKKYTHFVAVSFSNKEAREKAIEQFGEEGANEFTPILGNLSAYSAPEPTYEAADVKEDNGDIPDFL